MNEIIASKPDKKNEIKWYKQNNFFSFLIKGHVIISPYVITAFHNAMLEAISRWKGQRHVILCRENSIFHGNTLNLAGFMWGVLSVNWLLELINMKEQWKERQKDCE